jgi:chemotaxis protein MotB
MAHDRRKQEDHEEHENLERYLVTYADMLTLLLALFIVLYSMSMLNKSKFEAFQSSFKKNKATGQPELTQPNPIRTPAPPKPQPPATITAAQMEKLKEDLTQALAKAHLQNAAQLSINKDGLSVSLTDGVLFDSGQADLLAGGVRVLEVIGPRLTKFNNLIHVEGHTDNQPISNSRYADNWDLSSARAMSVVRYFLWNDHIAGDRLDGTGYADTRPKVANDTPAHRAVNRRVVVLIRAN